MDPRALIVLLLVFGMGVVILLLVSRRQKHPYASRLEIFNDKKPAEEESSGSILREAKRKRSGIFSGFVEWTGVKLLRAGVSTNLRPFFSRVFIFAATGALIGGLFSGVLGLLGGLVVGGTIPYIMIHMKFRGRMKKLESDLPTALQFIVNALRAGHALNSSLAIVGSEGPIGARDDFAQLNDSLRLGVPITQAFEQLLHKTPSVDLRFMATAMLIQRETGGNLTEILDRLQAVVLERKKMRGKVQALTGQARMGGYVVGGLPFILAGGMSAINPEYLMPMIKTDLGNYALAAAFVMQVAGFLVMRKIINIKL